MKKLIIVIVLIVGAFSTQAQNSEFMKFYDKYSTNENFTIVSVNERMLTLFSDIDTNDEDAEAIKETMKGLKGIKLIANKSTADGPMLFSEAEKAFNRGYDELMSVRDGDSDIRFLIQEKNGLVNELVMLVGSDSSFVAASIFGNIDLNQIGKMAKGLKINGLEELEKLEEEDSNK